jgi:hypothetical protein
MPGFLVTTMLTKYVSNIERGQDMEWLSPNMRIMVEIGVLVGRGEDGLSEVEY